MSEFNPSSASKKDWHGLDPLVDREALDRLFSVTYEELRRLASRVKRSDWRTSISPTALVNEAWIKLADSPSFRSTSPLHFKRIAARAMRQVLVEAARRRHAAKRGGRSPSLSPSTKRSVAHVAPAARPARARRRARRACAHEPAPGRAWSRAGSSAVSMSRKPPGCSECRRRPCSATGGRPRPGSIVRSRASSCGGLRPAKVQAGLPIDATRWERVQPLFHDAADRPAAERPAFLTSACADDEALLRGSPGVLDAMQPATPLLDRDLADVARRVLGDGVPAALAARGSGPTASSRLLGEGGMGVVYLAVRDDLGSVAAIKILRDAWLSPARRERFASEQRTLAQLNHPSIAQLYDADTLPDGTPVVRHGVRRRRAAHRLLPCATAPRSPIACGCFAPSARRCSTPIGTLSFTAISSRRTSS